MGGKTSEYAYQTGRTLARNTKPTPAGLAALENWEGRIVFLGTPAVLAGHERKMHDGD